MTIAQIIIKAVLKEQKETGTVSTERLEILNSLLEAFPSYEHEKIVTTILGGGEDA